MFEGSAEKSQTLQQIEPDQPPPTNKLKRVFRHRDFRLLWSGAFLSFIGSWIEAVAQGYVVYQLTKSEYLLGLVTFFGMLPVTVIGLFAGSLADMFNKRILLVVTQSVFALGSMFLAAATYFGFVQYWHLVTVALILGTVNAIDMPTRQSIVSRVVPPEDIQVAIPINAMTFNLARLIGPTIGGLILAWWGPSLCYFVNSLSFLAIIFAGLAIRADLTARTREPQPLGDLIMEGFLYTMRDVRLRTIFILESCVSIFALFYIPQIPAIADKMLNLPKTDLAPSYLAVGIGAVAALVATLSLADKPFKALLLRIAITTMGVGLLLLSMARSPWVAYPFFTLLGFASVLLFNTCNTLFQTLAPDRLRGRVLSMHVWALSGIGPFGIFGFGYLAERQGLPFAFQLGGGLVLIAAAYSWVYRKGLSGIG